MNLVIKQLIVLFTFIFLVGCAGRKDMEIPKNVFAKPSSIVIAQMTGLENVGFYKEGGEGLIDAVINEAMTSSVTESIKKINTTETVEEYYFKLFEIAFLDRSFKVNKLNEKLKRDSLPKYDGDAEKHATLDFRSLKDKHNVELALILEPIQYGVTRKYYGFIPMGSPKGYANLVVYLVRLEDNEVLGHYNASAQIETKGDWDVPPDYTELAKASKTALAAALNNAYTHFFVE